MADDGSTTATRRATMRDVADRAAVSKSLVSLAFSSPGSVGPERLRRILEAAEALGFRPNRVARSLNGARDDFVGILVADSRNPVLAEVVDAARVSLAAGGRLGLMTSAVLPDGSSRPRLDLDAVAMLGDLQPSGLIVVGSVPSMDRVVQAMGAARIVIASARPGRLAGAATVRGDDEVGIRLVIEHLVGLGHQRIGHVGGAGGRVATGRASAFGAAMRERGLDGSVVAESDFSEAAGFRAAQELLDRDDPPTAITAVNDLSAIGVMAAVRQRGRAASVAVTGYDNTYLAALGAVDLTSVDPDNAAIGRRAAELLLSDQDPGEVLIAPTLRVRSSSVPPSG
ncbi:LacI family DNA-binding transcriptional regulator [Curtobacterium sp. MCPF17_002]|uniref:LacI family DNA-binding transcriptional regulator n=1 Tax=Curtobacterium sp. MCPF17_002 TaxID=2175645 RepID=UPI0021AD3653|nr:LacI family DNA-binding transcriptional regulator [Curtobacterium sp. MCPF17_002]WIB77704.1 LacI family DNA-binding transcriptional regulator [Curtobacterium sp. MCPF17_002]